MPIFIKNNYYINIEKNSSESDDSFNKRGWFIVSQKPITEKEYNDAILMSYIMINIETYKCTYDLKIMEKLNKMQQYC